jgi:Rha family phage regulatory protein
MNQLVEVRRGEVFCDSQMVADKFKKQHAYVRRSIEKLLAELKKKGSKSLTLKFDEVEREYRGQAFKVYLMNRSAFSLLAMRFTGSEALDWQIKFNEAFYLMEKRLLLEASNKASVEWTEQRKQGKLARKAETDTIKDFVEYATNQGSTQAQFYYKHITIACYRCLNLIESQNPKLRNTLDVMQLNQLILAEHIAEKSIRRHMAAGEHYKAVFSLVKVDLERFAESLMLGYPAKQIQIAED